ncbi:hypothetical protein BpHYR1_040096, partial [Brachionus plicatilis]
NFNQIFYFGLINNLSSITGSFHVAGTLRSIFDRPDLLLIKNSKVQKKWKNKIFPSNNIGNSAFHIRIIFNKMAESSKASMDKNE